MEIRQWILKEMTCRGAVDLAVKADERRMEMRRGKIIAVSLTVCAVGTGMTVNAYAGQHHI